MREEASPLGPARPARGSRGGPARAFGSARGGLAPALRCAPDRLRMHRALPALAKSSPAGAPRGPRLLLVFLHLIFLTAAVAQEREVPGLREGNRLFRGGELEEAMGAYAAGWKVTGDPVLAYNLGTTAQRLGRLPEAVLWYRRAEGGLGGDPWLRDNLAAARQALGGAAVPAGPLAVLAEWREAMTWAGVALAWVAVPLAWGRGRGRGARWGVVGVGLLAVALFAGGTVLALRGPFPAVLLEACGESLTAGSEVWVVPSVGGDRVLGAPGGLVCPAGAVGQVETRR